MNRHAARAARAYRARLSRRDHGESLAHPPPDTAARVGPPAPELLGPCCICAHPAETATSCIQLLPRKNIIRGHGWGCTVCGLDFDGAAAVICGVCLPRFDTGELALRFACRGYPATEGRVELAELVLPHHHDRSRHEN